MKTMDTGFHRWDDFLRDHQIRLLFFFA